jgi:hypothetical protein
MRYVAILVAGLGLAVPRIGSGQQLTLYDDFGGRQLNVVRWQGSESQASTTAPNTDASRRIVQGKLQLMLTSFGATDSDSGTSGGAAERLRLTSPDTVTTLQASVTVRQAVAQGCSENSSPSYTRAMLFGSFFNDGASSGAGDRTGDVSAGIQKLHDSVGRSAITAFVSRCGDPTCSSGTTVGSHLFATPLSFGRADTLGLRWDQAGHQFVFTVNPHTSHQESATISYSGTDVAPPAGGNIKELLLSSVAAQCSAGARRVGIDSRFDNVRVNS